MSHTSGPWELRWESTGHQNTRFSDWAVIGADGSVVAPSNIYHEDALLIAAAPDMLIACKAALNDRMFADWPEIATLLKNAIAKAEGE